MSYSFERIPRIIWGCGDNNYGDKDAKIKASKIMSEESHIFISQGLIRDYTNINLQEEVQNMDSIYTFGYLGYSIPVEIAKDLLKKFNMNYFDGFMLRDINLMTDDTKNRYRIDNAKFKTHLVLDFDGYGSNQRTSHCYD